MSETIASLPFGGLLPLPLLESGAIAGLGRAELAVWVGIVAHADRAGRSWPSVSKLAAIAGIHVRTAERALQRLIERGLLTVIKPGGGRSATTIYAASYSPPSDIGLNGDRPERNEKPRHSYAGDSREKPRCSYAGEFAENPGNSEPKPRHFATETPAISSVNPGEAVPGEHVEHENTPPSPPKRIAAPSAGAGAAEREMQTREPKDAAEVLIAAGVSPAAAAGIARLPGRDANTLRAFIEDRRRRGLTLTGALVNAARGVEFERFAECRNAAAADLEQRAKTFGDGARAAADRAAAARREREAIEAAFREIPEAELPELWSRAAAFTLSRKLPDDPATSFAWRRGAVLARGGDPTPAAQVELEASAASALPLIDRGARPPLRVMPQDLDAESEAEASEDHPATVRLARQPRPQYEPPELASASK